MRYNTPDQIIGIGGGGKDVIYKLFVPGIKEANNIDELAESDLRTWVIDEVMDPKGVEINRHHQERMDAFILDTDTDEANNEDRPKTNKISELLNQRENAHSQSVRGPTISYSNLVEDSTTKADHLLSKNKAKRVKKQTGISCWWLNSDNVDPHDDFGGGVFRRRSLSKALYGMSQIGTDDPIEDLRNAVTSTSDVAMVVGIGGGTGAGTFLDIAKTLKYERGFPDITLFAVLPHHDEESDIGANAYAALSELEYISLTDQQLFESIILIPQFSEASEGDFDEAIVRTILSYYNIQGNGRNKLGLKDAGRLKSFAPFTLAATQILQYEGGMIKQAKKSLEQFYEDKEESLSKEESLHDQFESFLETYHSSGTSDANVYEEYVGRGTNPKYSLNEEEVTTLINRINELEDLVNLRVLPSIGCTITEELKEDIETAKNHALDSATFDDEDVSESQRKRAIVDAFPEQSNINPSIGEDKPEDTRILDLYEREIEAIRRQREQLRAKNMLGNLTEITFSGDETTTTAEKISASTVRSVFSSVLDKNSDTTQNPTLENDLDSLANKKKKYQRQNSDFNEIEDVLIEECSKKLEEWEGSISAEIQTLTNLSTHEEEIHDLLAELEQALKTAERVAHKATSADEIPNSVRLEFSKEQFEHLKIMLEDCNIDPINKTAVHNEVQYLWEAKRQWLKDSEDGFLFFGSGPETEELKRNHSQEHMNANRSDLDMAWIPQWDERPDESGKLRTVELERRKDALDRINPVDKIENSIENFLAKQDIEILSLVTETKKKSFDNPELLKSLEVPRIDVSSPELDSEFEGARRNGKETLNELISPGGAIYNVFHSAYLGNLEQEIRAVQDNIDEIKSEIKWAEEIAKLQQAGGEFGDIASNVNDPSSVSEVEDDGSEEGIYITRESPDDPGELLTNDHIGETNFWERKGGQLDLSLRKFTERMENDLFPLKAENISVAGVDTARDDYDEHYPVISAMSRVFEQDRVSGTGDSGALEAVNSSMGAIFEECQKPDWNRVKFGGPWDLTLSIFLGGVMLDNLNYLEQSGQGLKDKYESIRGDNDDFDMIDHHVHGIDGKDQGRVDGHQLFEDDYDGAYLYRKSILNLATMEDKCTLLNNLGNEKALRDKLLKRYEFVPFDSTKNLDED